MATSIEPIAAKQNTPPVAGNSGNVTAQRFAQSAQLFNLTLLNLLEANTQPSTTTKLDNADLLTLSPEALNILNGVENASTVSSSTPLVTDATFDAPLSLQQQNSLGNILEQFNGQSLDQNTFAQIQGQLVAAGINPQQISIQELILALGTTSLPSAMAYDVNAAPDVLATELLAA